MRMNELSEQDIAGPRIRALQDRFYPAHAALLNWASWCRDPQIGPRLAKQHLLDAHDGDLEGYGEVPDEQLESVPGKPERREENYDEKTANILDERIHGHGGICLEYRRLLRVAYVYPPIEYQMPKFSGCHDLDEFCFRLTEILRFVSRFV